jgi:hypothetical protein
MNGSDVSEPSIRKWLYLNLARVGGFHLQGMEGRSHSELLQALANAADGSLRLARRVKIKRKNDFQRFYLLGIYSRKET